MSVYVSTFNPLRMEMQEILALATGREHLLNRVLVEMERCLKPQSNHHFLLHGPRGIGKSYFTKYLKIKCKRLPQFNNSLFIQLPEEQSNLQFVGDLIEMLCAAIQNQSFQNIQAKWEVDDAAWRNAIKKLKQLIKEQKADKPDFHIFFSMENLQDFIPQLDEIENGRLREFLEQFKNISLIGTSVRPDLDNNYDKRLFHVFKKYPLNPWTLDDCLAYYDKRVAFLKEHGENPLKDVELNRQKVKAISVFTGGSPRIAVILNRLVLEENIESVADTLRGIIDELTPYYQDLTKAMPPKTKLLFDTLIRHGENMTQSKLAELLGKQQNVISKPFRWLKENFYVKAIKQKQGNTYHYSVNDRMYSLYWQQREMLREGESIIALLAGFLFQFFGEREMLQKTKEAFKNDSSIKFDLLQFYSKDYDFEIGLKNRVDDILKREEDRINEAEKFKLKIEKLKEVVIKKPTYFNFNNLGSAYLRYGMLIQAEDEEKFTLINSAAANFQKSLEVEDNQSALNNLAYTKFFVGNIDGAISDFKENVKNDKENISSLYRLGAHLYSEDSFDLALKFYEAGLSIEPQNYGELIDTALLYFIVHNDDKGFEYLDRASKVNEAIKAEFTGKKSHQNIFSISKLLEHSQDRSRHELFNVMMTIFRFLKEENIWSFRYGIVIQNCLQQLYIYDKKDVLFDIISEVRNSEDKDSFRNIFLYILENIFLIPNLLDNMDTLKTSFAKLPPDYHSFLFHFLENLKSMKERFDSGKKPYWK